MKRENQPVAIPELELLGAPLVHPKFACFVTGTDTEIGKTMVSCALLHALVQCGQRAAGMKPVAAGAQLRDGVWHNEDVDCLAAAGNVELPQALTAPYVLREATAPHIAAAQEDVCISPHHILNCYRELALMVDALVVEGVGGFRVPLTDGCDTADLAQHFGLPVVLVVGMRLGCLNHALLTAEAIAARGLVLGGWVANCVDPAFAHVAENVAALTQRLAAPLLGYVPRLGVATVEITGEYLDFGVLPGWPGSGNLLGVS